VTENAPQVCDYEGSDYQERFWDRSDRAYEDRVEAIAIKRLLPGKGSKLSNSDPVTGQAAWYDLRVRVEKCKAEEEGVTEPLFPALKKWVKPLKLLRFGKGQLP